jgi:hypothetical protein
MKSYQPHLMICLSKYLAVTFVNKIKDATGGRLRSPPIRRRISTSRAEIFSRACQRYRRGGHYRHHFILDLSVQPCCDGLPMSFGRIPGLRRYSVEKGLGDILAQEYDKNGVIYYDFADRSLLRALL